MRRPASLAAGAILAATLLTGCGGGEGDTDAFCAVAEDISEDRNTADMTEEEVQESLDDLIDSAPDDIKDDLELVKDALDDPTSVDTGELQEAGDNLDSYVKDECGIDIGS